jgi:hypothetical protein
MKNFDGFFVSRGNQTQNSLHLFNSPLKLFCVNRKLNSMSKKSLLDSIQSPSPCSKNWNEMIGDDRVRFCGSCEKNVYNLLAMPAKEAHKFAAKNAGKVCIRYVRTIDGRVQTADAPELYKIGGRASRLTAGVFGAALTLSVMANAQTQMPPPKTGNQKAEVKAQNKGSAKTSQISFTLRDPNGAVIPGAEVKLVNQKTKEEFNALTNQEGVAEFFLLPRGSYDIKASFSGFKSYQESIQINQPIEPNVKIMLDVPNASVGVFVYDWSEIPLFRAIAQDDNDVVKQAIEAGFDVNTKDKKGETALHIAVSYGNLEIVKFLLEKGASVKVKDKSKRTPLAMLFDAFEDDEEIGREIIRLLASKGADVDIRSEDDETLLMAASSDDDVEVVKILLEAGANPNLKDEDGETALDKTDSEEIRQLLIRYGARKTEN